MRRLLLVAALGAGACVLGAASDASASSHREAPFVTKNPKVDSTDFYMFRSYESGRDGYVTIIANYQPFQENFGGPNYYELDPEALYEIHIDNNGDGAEDLTFQFNFHHAIATDGKGLSLDIDFGANGGKKTNTVPLLNIGGISAADNSKLHVNETYDLTVVAGDRRTGTASSVIKNATKPVDFIGTATFGSAAGYETYAKSTIKTFQIPSCTKDSKVFVGQRREGFAANIGPVFDLIQGPYPTNPASTVYAPIITGGSSPAGRGLNPDNAFDTGLLYNKNITSIALEVPIECVTRSATASIIGGWTSASMRQARVLNPDATYAKPSKEGGAWTQVSHLGMPLVNEVVIGLPFKDTFSAVHPKDTAKVADFVTHPTLPALIEVLYGGANPAVKAPKTIRTDLVGVFATGLTLKNKADGKDFNLNQTSTGPGNDGPKDPAPAAALPAGIYEYLRLNTAVAPTAKASQSKGLGALGCIDANRQLDLTAAGCDPAGFPNGRRPGDDTVDIALRVVMGALIADAALAPAHDIPFTDFNYNGPEQFDDTFPYLRTPLAGDVNPNVAAKDIAQK